MTPTLMQTAIHTMADLNSFFAMRVQLRESISPMISETPTPIFDFRPATYANIDDAHYRVDNRPPA
jgi:hypothetical protein